MLLDFFLLLKIKAYEDTTLMLYYKFDGNVNDYSGKNNYGTLIGGQYVDDRYRNDFSALYFNGTSDILVTTYRQINVSSMTYSFWLYIYNPSVSGTICQSRGDGNGFSITVAINSGKIQFLLNGPFKQCGVFSNVPLTPKTWNHIVCVWKGVAGIPTTNSNFKIYINGNMVSTTDVNFNHPPPSATYSGDSTLFIGYHKAWNSYFKGIIDDFKVYERALSSNEIDSMYNVEKKYIHIISPNKGDVMLQGTSTTITWTKSPVIKGVDIKYTIDDITWKTVAENITDTFYN